MTYVSPDLLIVPTSDIVQSPIAAVLLGDFTVLADHDLISFVGSTVDIEELRAYELAHFSDTSLYLEWRARPSIQRLQSLQFAIHSREVNTTADVKFRWAETVKKLQAEKELTSDVLLAKLHDLYSIFSPQGQHRREHLARDCDIVRSAASRARGAIDALNAAASSAALFAANTPSPRPLPDAIGTSPRAPGAVAARRHVRRRPGDAAGSTTVLLAFALAEELEAGLAALQPWVSVVTPQTDTATGRISYIAHRRTNGGQRIRLVIVLIGRGEERAAAVSGAVISTVRPQIVASLGIVGALSSDLEICDVVIGEQIVSYLANAKATSSQSDSLELQLAGDAMRSDEYLVHRLVQLPMIAGEQMRLVRERLQRAVPTEHDRCD